MGLGGVTNLHSVYPFCQITIKSPHPSQLNPLATKSSSSLASVPESEPPTLQIEHLFPAHLVTLHNSDSVSALPTNPTNYFKPLLVEVYCSSQLLSAFLSA
jgi:hypothetical protein